MKPGNGQAAGQGRVKVVRELGWIHFIAVGGTGMGSLAGLVAARGIRVTGSDRDLYPPMSTALSEWGIPVVEGFSPANLEDADGARPACHVEERPIGFVQQRG